MKFRKRKNTNGGRFAEPGQDSFLDVVANLIGILIILVMLVGSQAEAVWHQLRTEDQTAGKEIESLEKGIEQRAMAIAKLTSENSEMESSIGRQKKVAAQLKQQRDRLQLGVQALHKKIKQKSAELSDEQRIQQQHAIQVAYLEENLASWQGKAKSLTSQRRPVKKIEHLPTPIAKTVFGEEVHFRLKNGRLVHVPLNDLVILMRSEWKVKAKKLIQAPSTIETVGPASDFRLQYKLVLTEQTQKTEHGIVKSMVPSLDRFILLPVREPLGEPFENAIRPESQFFQLLAGLNPEETTISVWVYPDSFGQFNELKKVFFEKGFLCAGWPLPEHQPISGSPKGFRTAAQ